MELYNLVVLMYDVIMEEELKEVMEEVEEPETFFLTFFLKKL